MSDDAGTGADRANASSRLHVELVETERDAAHVAARLAHRHPGVLVACVLSADLGDVLGPVLAALRPVVAELVCFDALTPAGRTGPETAAHLLEDLGVGQDFVFTVGDLDDAIEYALARTAHGDAAHWDATAVLVVGPGAVVEAASRHGTRPGAAS